MLEQDALTKKIELSSGTHTYCDVGKGDRTLLLLHGFAFRQGMYPLMGILKADCRVVVPDLPFSTILAFYARHTLESYVGFLLELVQAMGLKNVSIFGNSVGGTLALMCGVKRPERFERLIVRCPLWSRKQLPNYLQVKALVNLHTFLSGNRLYARGAASLSYNISTRISPVARQTNASSIPYQDGQVDPVVLSRFLGHLVQVEIEKALRFIPNKTLIIWGALDSFITSEWGRALNRILPDSRYVEMEEEYHNIATSNSKALAKQIFSFAIQ